MGSATFSARIGIVFVAFFSASEGGVLIATSTSGLRDASSAASGGSSALLLFAPRPITVRFTPSLYPRSCSVLTKAGGVSQHAPTGQSTPTLKDPGAGCAAASEAKPNMAQIANKSNRLNFIVDAHARVTVVGSSRRSRRRRQLSVPEGFFAAFRRPW